MMLCQYCTRLYIIAKGLAAIATSVHFASSNIDANVNLVRVQAVPIQHMCLYS